MTSISPDELTRFAIPGVLRFEPGEGNLIRAVVTHPAATGELYLHGAHVTGWTPQGNHPVLFMSSKSEFDLEHPIRGGVPICFPWFGPKADDPDAPPHGLARIRTWQITDTAADPKNGVTVELAAIIEPFRLTYRVEFGNVLRMSLTVQNAGTTEARFEEALHTYLRVGDVRQVELEGLEGVEYLDKVTSGQRRREGNEPIRVAGETDRVYLGTQNPCTLRDPSLGRTVHIAKSGSNATVVWNPWIDKAARMPDFGDEEWPSMICVETCNVIDDAITLAPGDAHEMTAELRVTAD